MLEKIISLALVVHALIAALTTSVTAALNAL
jgi:hypothetical protein